MRGALESFGLLIELNIVSCVVYICVTYVVIFDTRQKVFSNVNRQNV